MHLLSRYVRRDLSVSGRDPTNVDLASGSIAIVLRRQKKIDAAQALFEASIEFRAKRYGQANPQTLRARHGLGNCLMDREDYAAAEVQLVAAADGLKDTLGQKHEWTLAASLSSVSVWRWSICGWPLWSVVSSFV